LDLFGHAAGSLGHAVIKSCNGRMAWEILNANDDIAFIICDIAMPEMDGRELIKLIRKDSRFARVPIVIVSSVIRAKEISHLLEEGATYFMPKPVDLKELKDVINNHLK